MSLASRHCRGRSVTKRRRVPMSLHLLHKALTQLCRLFPILIFFLCFAPHKNVLFLSLPLPFFHSFFQEKDYTKEGKTRFIVGRQEKKKRIFFFFHFYYSAASFLHSLRHCLLYIIIKSFSFNQEFKKRKKKKKLYISFFTIILI